VNKPFTIALVGNPNCGKTTLFNRLTGTHQSVGNWPGVTVERKTGSFTHEGRQFLVVDLPGTFSLHVSRDDDAIDQQIAQAYVLAREADLIVNIIDASSIARGLYLSSQLFDASVPVVVALNMVDVAQSQGVHVDAHRLAACLGCPVVPLVASRGEGVRALIEEVCAGLQTRQPPPQRMALDATLESALLRVQAALDPADAGPAGRMLAGALLARDAAVLERIGEAARARVLAIVDELEATLGGNAGDALIGARYQAIGTIVDQAVRTEDAKRFNLTDALDRVLLNRVLAFPLLLGVMYLMFMLMATGGLLVTANAGPMARSWGLTAAALTLATTLSPLANGGSRVFWGWASDRLGRENTMVFTFVLQAICLLLVIVVGQRSGGLFALSLVLVYFTWGQIYSLFPATSADYFGVRHATSNYAVLYSAKGVASIIGGWFGASLYERFGNWEVAFYGSALMAFVAALLAVALRASKASVHLQVPVEAEAK